MLVLFIATWSALTVVLVTGIVTGQASRQTAQRGTLLLGGAAAGLAASGLLVLLFAPFAWDRSFGDQEVRRMTAGGIAGGCGALAAMRVFGTAIERRSAKWAAGAGLLAALAAHPVYAVLDCLLNPQISAKELIFVATTWTWMSLLFGAWATIPIGVLASLALWALLTRTRLST